MKRTTIKGLLAAAALATVAITATACEVPEDGTTHAEEVVKQVDAKADKKAEGKDKSAKDEAPEPEYTTSQEQAIASAVSYLDTMDFSKTGLIEQLQFEQFSAKDAQFAVDHIDVDWNVQAASAAQTYLETMAFSRGELIDQLEFEGYTTSQATHGVNTTGL